jgi:hypothetical protein
MWAAIDDLSIDGAVESCRPAIDHGGGDDDD